jgi:hypothetical protein
MIKNLGTPPPASEVVERIVTAVGSYRQVGLLLGVSGWAVRKWVLKDPVPAPRILQLCKIATDHGIDVRPYDIDPVLYPKELFKDEC